MFHQVWTTLVLGEHRGPFGDKQFASFRGSPLDVGCKSREKLTGKQPRQGVGDQVGVKGEGRRENVFSQKGWMNAKVCTFHPVHIQGTIFK